MADIEQELLSEAVAATDAEILNEAFQDQPAEQPEVTEAEPERPDNRDEKGRFTAKAEEKTEPEKIEAETPKEQEQDDHGQIPSWRLREVAEERRAAKAEAEQAKREADALKVEMAQLRQQIQQSQKPKDEPKQEEIDPLIDPQGFAKRLQSSFQEQLREVQLNNNLALASVKHGEKFDAAYNAFVQAAQQGDRLTYQSVMNSPNPGEAMVRWHAQQMTLKEVGADPAAYKQKVLDEAMKDPAFQAKVIELVKGGSVQPGQRPQNNITQLPPSLSRATGSKSGSSIEDDTDNSDGAVFSYAFR